MGVPIEIQLILYKHYSKIIYVIFGIVNIYKECEVFRSKSAVLEPVNDRVKRGSLIQG